MAKKKSRKNKKREADGSPAGRKMQAVAWSAGAVAVALAGVTWMASRKQRQGPPAPATGRLTENRPILNFKMFTGKAATAYQIAAAIPKVIDSQFCYCYCKRDHGHKTLLTCFTNLHGSKCEICMGEVIYAYQLFQDRMSLDGIVKAVDKQFYRPYRGHRL